MKIKICGIPDMDVAEKIVALKPDAVGIYCWGNPQKGKNISTPGSAREIVSLASARGIDSFYLTYNENAMSLIDELRLINPTHVQLVGDMSLEQVTKLKTAFPDLKTVKVIGVVNEESIKEAKIYAESDVIDEILLDTRSGNIRGGTGKTHDWNISRRIVECINKPTWVAGGMKKTNVGEAMATIKPYGIDLETGIQNADGSKNYELALEMVRLVHGFTSE